MEVVEDEEDSKEESSEEEASEEEEEEEETSVWKGRKLTIEEKKNSTREETMARDKVR